MRQNRNRSVRDLAFKAFVPVAALLLVTCLASMAVSAEALPADAAQPVVCQLTANNGIAYRTGVGPWLSQSEGTYSTVIPTEIKTGKAMCRLQVGELAFFEATPSSDFRVRFDEKGKLELSVKSGSVLYALGDGVALTIVTPPAEVAAEIGAGPAKDKPVSVYTAVADMGIVRVLAPGEATVEYCNLRGTMGVTREGGQTQAVPVGQSIRFSSGQSQSPAPLSLVSAGAIGGGGGGPVVAGPAAGAETAEASQPQSGKKIDYWRIIESENAPTSIEVEPAAPTQGARPAPVPPYRPPASPIRPEW